MKRLVSEESKDVLCMRESLSEQDFERLGGASAREGLRRTCPRSWKLARPGRVEVSVGAGEEVTVGRSHGVASSCAAMVSSMEASPQGASEQ
jgi:hypothetical protein